MMLKETQVIYHRLRQAHSWCMIEMYGDPAPQGQQVNSSLRSTSAEHGRHAFQLWALLILILRMDFARHVLVLHS